MTHLVGPDDERDTIVHVVYIIGAPKINRFLSKHAESMRRTSLPKRVALGQVSNTNISSTPTSASKVQPSPISKAAASPAPTCSSTPSTTAGEATAAPPTAWTLTDFDVGKPLGRGKVRGPPPLYPAPSPHPTAHAGSLPLSLLPPVWERVYGA